MKRKATFQVEVEFDDEATDPEALATALDRLMATATSTPGILEEYGDPEVGEFLVAGEVPKPIAEQPAVPVGSTVGPLWKATAVIWSEEDPQKMELSTLAREAETGDAYCSSMKAERVAVPEKDPDWDGTEFFGVPEDDPAESPEDRQARLVDEDVDRRPDSDDPPEQEVP